MNKKSKIIASVLSITVLASSIFTIASFGGGIFVRSRAENNYSITFSRSVSTIESGSYGNNPVVISSRLPNTGVKVLATINDDSNLANENHIFRFGQSDDKSVVFSFESNIYGIKAFQGITSLVFTYESDTYNDPVNILLSNDNKTFDSFTTNDGQTTFVPSDLTYRYLSITSIETSWTRVKSLTITYSCSLDYIEPEEVNPYVGTFACNNTSAKNAHYDELTLSSDGTGSFISAGTTIATITWEEVEEYKLKLTKVNEISETSDNYDNLFTTYTSKTITMNSEYASFSMKIYYNNNFGPTSGSKTFTRVS